MASGMLYSTASDLAKFLSLFFRDGPAGGAQVLGGSSLRLMTVPVAVSVDSSTIWRTGSAIGWIVGLFGREQVNYKGGGTAGFSSVVMINYQKKLGVALLTNTEAEPFHIGYLALQKLTPVVRRISERQLATARAQNVHELNALVGRYVLADTAAEKLLTFRAYDVSVANNRLVMTVPERSATSVVHIQGTPLDVLSPGVFRMAGGSFYGNIFTFATGGDGRLRLTWRGYTFVRTR